MKKKKEMPKPRKPEDKKLKHRVPVSLTETDFKDLEDFKTAERIDENSDAVRRILRWAFQKMKSEKQS